MLARPAAIKLIRRDAFASDPAMAKTAVDRFEREAQVIASLQSPHTVALYDFGVTEDGAMGDVFTVPAAMCMPVPDSVSLQNAALIEPFACVLNTMQKVGGVHAGQTVHIFGLGAIGLTAVILNLAVSAVLTLVLRATRVPAGTDETLQPQYTADPVDAPTPAPAAAVLGSEVSRGD